MESAEFQNLLNLIKLVGGKFVIVEDGAPKAVLMSYDEFSALATPTAIDYLAQRIDKMPVVEQVNSEITRAQLDDLRAEVILEEPEITIEPLDPI